MTSDVVADASAAVGTRNLRAWYAALAATAAVVGVLTIPSTMLGLWSMWTTDALKSVGMVVPIVSLVLILRGWKQMEWRADGSWWGLGLILVAMAGSWVSGTANLILVITPQVMRVFPPAALVFFIYGIGVVTLFGGLHLLRIARFPVLLLLLVNPIPHVFALRVDMPLQRIGAQTARALAIHLGQKLTPDQLHLMFTPNFGMFIAPGCNGLRGAVTMGLIALVAGYVYRFSWIARLGVTLGAILLGYIFNLLRLCTLVFYYLVALRVEWLQSRAETGDYIIGAILFLIATVILFSVIDRLREGGDIQRQQMHPQSRPEPCLNWAPTSGNWGRATAFAAFAIVSLPLCRDAFAAEKHSSVDPAAAAQALPRRVGHYVLTRTWDETLANGPIAYVWGQYESTNGEPPVSLGISPIANWHSPLVCHSVRGDAPLWQGQVAFKTPTGEARFSSALYSDGITQRLASSTLCDADGCDEQTAAFKGLNLVSSLPRFRTLVSSTRRHPTRILVQTETAGEQPQDQAYRDLISMQRQFLSSLNISQLAGWTQAP